jgi:hypothetical protein
MKEDLFLSRGFLDEAREPGFDRLQFPEVRMQANEVRKSAHVSKVSWRGNLSNSCETLIADFKFQISAFSI